MKTIGIMIAMTALAIGAQQMGYVDYHALLEKSTPFLEDIGVCDKEPRYIIIGLDITAGREGELDKDRAAITEIVKRAREGDRIDLYLIHSRSETEQEAVFSAEMPDNGGPAGQELVRAKQKTETEWATCWGNKIIPLLDSDKKQRTDLFGFMRYASSQNADFQAHKHPVLVLFTDGQQVGDGYNMEKKAPIPGLLQKMKDDDLMPDLSGVKVRFAGVTPTHKISNAHWRKIQSFWTDYAKEAGAESVTVTSDRRISMK